MLWTGIDIDVIPSNVADAISQLLYAFLWDFIDTMKQSLHLVPLDSIPLAKLNSWTAAVMENFPKTLAFSSDCIHHRLLKTQ